MSVSCFENLPNEIIRQVFLYFSLQELLEVWINMNDRMDGIIVSLDQKVSFIGNNVTSQALKAAYILRKHVVSLMVSKRWCNMIPYYQDLQALKIIGIAPQFSMSKLTPEMFPRLKYVEYGFECFHWNEFMERSDCYYARQIVQCYIRSLSESPSIVCSTLRSIRIATCSSQYLSALLRSAPNLANMDIGICMDINFDLANIEILSIETPTEESEHLPDVLSPMHHFDDILHNQLRHVKLHFHYDVDLGWIDEFLRSTPNVTHFNLSIGGAYKIFSFEEFYHIIACRLPNLIPEKFRLEYSCIAKPFDLEQHRLIAPLFKNMIAETKTYEHQYPPLSLLNISVNWKNNNDYDDIYEYFDDDDDF